MYWVAFPTRYIDAASHSKGSGRKKGLCTVYRVPYPYYLCPFFSFISLLSSLFTSQFVYW